MFKRVAWKVAQVAMLFGFENLAMRIVLATIDPSEGESPQSEIHTKPEVIANDPWVVKIVWEDADIAIKNVLEMKDVKLGKSLYDVN